MSLALEVNINNILLYRHLSVLLENVPLIKIYKKPHLGLKCHIFIFFTSEDIHLMISVISSVSLKLYLFINSFTWCIVETSSGLLQKSLVIFSNLGNLYKFSENVECATFA